MATEFTTTTTEMNAALDKEFIDNFKGEYDRLAEVLGIFKPEVMRAGQTLERITITGNLNNGANHGDASDANYSPTATTNPNEYASSGSAYSEGDIVSLSKYSATKTPVGTVKVMPYRKLTTAEAILKGGYEVAMLRTDKKMLSHLRVQTLSSFFGYLTGTNTTVGSSFTCTTATAGSSLQASLAYVSAQLQDELESHGDQSDDIVYFVNRQDIAKYLANANITTQNLFGMTYLESFLGVNKIFATNQIASGTVWATPTENLHIYGLDFSSLGNAGLSYTTESNGLIGVAHTPAYDRVSAETHVLNGMLIFPEVANYICKSTIAETA